MPPAPAPSPGALRAPASPKGRGDSAPPLPLAGEVGAARAAPGEGERHFLTKFAARLRTLRAQRGMTRRALAKSSGISERYLGQIESGHGNPSLLALRALARAFGLTPAALLEEEDAAQRHSRTARALAALTPAEAEAALRFVVANFRPEEANRRARRLALIGLRGAGKSTIGRLLATHFNRPFLELDALIAEEAGMDLAGIFELHGQAAFRRFERAALEKILAGAQDFVLATGGGIVADPGTFERLLGGCLTIWLRASPEEHMRRVIAQGDPRPMAQNPRAMDDLRAILLSREPLYARADITLDTTGIDPLAGMAALLPLIG